MKCHSMFQIDLQTFTEKVRVKVHVGVTGKSHLISLIIILVMHFFSADLHILQGNKG